MDDAPACYRHPTKATRITCQRCGRPICPACMNPGAVGFQCPECVASGARQTRQVRLPYGGKRVSDARITSIFLIAMNAVLWLAIVVTGGAASRLLDQMALLPVGLCRAEELGYYYPNVTDAATCAAQGLEWSAGVATGAPWQVVTSGFTHVNIMHIGFNMFVLWMLGPQLERVLGRARFLVVYGVSLLAGSAAVMAFSEPTTQTLGASGAIYGLLGAVLLLALRHQGNVRQILIWLGLNIVFSFVFPGISWQGHIGGLVGGLAVTAALVFLPREQRAKLQWPLVVVVALLFVAVIVVRALQLA